MPATPPAACLRSEPHERRTTAAAGAAPTPAHVSQLQDKARSLLRGLEHVQRCAAGAACGSALCHSTRRLLRTFATHECSRSPDCRVCRLWGFLTAAQARRKAADPFSAPAAPRTDQMTRIGAPADCAAAARARRLSARAAPSAIRRRVLVAAREAAAVRRI